MKQRALERRSKAPAEPARLLDSGDRLVASPVFLFSSVRSGSTLLRAVLNSHSQVCAPHEMHLGSMRVGLEGWFLEKSMAAQDLTPRDLENLLWDRLLHLQLARSGKRIVVDKTPYNTIHWKRVSQSWPQARFLFLKRHPLRVFQSLAASRPDLDVAEHYAKVTRYARAMHAAQSALPGLAVRYEDLTTDPETVVSGICRWLDVDWEPAMINYGAHHHGPFRRGLGDWSDNIKSGHITPAPPHPQPDEIPHELHEACTLLGYPVADVDE